MVDTGVDAGVGSGVDSGVDSGVHSGVDSVVDSGVDSGTENRCILWCVAILTPSRRTPLWRLLVHPFYTSIRTL